MIFDSIRMATSKKANVKTNILPHSKAKLDLYKSYLSEYLPILGLSEFISVINIFDIFCGTGVYDDGNIGSPVIAANCILEYHSFCNTNHKRIKRTRLFINDYDSEKVNNVKELISTRDIKNCDIEFFNLDASLMFDKVYNKICSFDRSERNLVFIDPYGYSAINKQALYNILSSRRSEIILFLPVAQMRRFTDEALTALDRKDYENLRKFIFDFFPKDSKIFTDEKVPIFEYIDELKNAFSFGEEFYTASHYIQRDKVNYYALFFIGHHIYGLDKFIEAKWKNDTLGRGFNQSNGMGGLFGSTLEEYDKNLSLARLEVLTRELFEKSGVLNNRQLYEFTLKNQFRPSHMTQLLRQWKSDRKINIYSPNMELLDNVRGFALDYDSYKGEAKYLFKKR
ncbi:MAG TPA: three-Cys-motif partner protein TcmP [Flavipsychrobacter sp.]